MSELNNQAYKSAPQIGFSGLPADISIDAPQELASAAWPALGRNGQAGVALVIKATLSPNSNGLLQLRDDASEIEPTERFYADARLSSLAAAGDMVPCKQGSEIIIHGAAQPCGEKAAVAAGFSLYRRDSGVLVDKWVWALGERESDSRGRIGAPEPITTPVPIRYEYAYGGPREAPLSHAYPFNPVGCGYRRWGAEIVAEEIPRIVRPRLKPPGRGTPPGFGPIPAGWAPRAGRFGKIDEKAYRLGEIRYLQPPHPAAYNYAPDDQRLAEPLQGNESITLGGLIPQTPCGDAISWHLPGLVPHLELVRRWQWETVSLSLDTLTIDTDRREATLSWRGWLSGSQATMANGMRVFIDHPPGCLASGLEPRSGALNASTSSSSWGSADGN
ncbi:DUF2169 domain-containing protein [Halorhodospira halochloris]|uniref:DUF2169 domain-containing protein n=1 Tax=Halorhodospira halochloris TaxID=1052 RepID=UPI001EE9641D|nr:DUF2169 domain-containing protein [Halorhodospira halochloris]MCG5529641.1 DUF2169 domain-containing protein [Halorhodospira halochloris]